jgi:predicted O-methyltransferase YrrM
MGAIVPDRVEEYLAGLNRLTDPILENVAHAGRESGLPLIDAEVGALLRVLATAVAATRILEIGTAIGYSGIWLAGALPPGGMLLTIEARADRAKQARDNFARAGLSERATVIVGDALLLVAKVTGPFDLIFQDGDKLQYGPMLERLVALLRPGGLLVTDNILWSGEVVPGFVDTPRQDAEETRAIVSYNERLTRHAGLLTSIVPIRDGVSISVRAS